MAVTPTYPGVYIEEVPSGVRTITGVATSITAFIGSARRGPIHRAVRVLGFADFERRFGGLSRNSDMTYAVRSFFTNGGSEAWIVRVAAASTRATRTLQNGAPANVLEVTARDAGSAGNDIRIVIDYDTSSPASTFNLTATYAPADDPASRQSETFSNLSMNSSDPRFVENVINERSELIEVNVVGTVPAATRGVSRSGALATADWQNLDAAHSRFRISANGSDPVEVTIPTPVTAADLNAFAGVVETAVQTAGASVPALATMNVNVVNTNQLEFESAVGGEASSVRITPAPPNDATVRLRLGPLAGGQETDAAAAIRPALIPLGGSLSGASITETNTLPSATSNTLRINLDGGTTRTVTVTGAAAASLADLAARLQTAVRALDTASPAYRDFTVQVLDLGGTNRRVVLRSGTRGTNSSVVVQAGLTNDLAGALGLLAGATSAPGTDATLSGGSETDFNPASPFAAVIASRANREGIYALEDVDLFNILCIPGVTDGPTLAEAVAYCQERRAFMVIDAPEGQSPDQMETVVTGTALPKSSYAAVYYPWIRVGDPLNAGALRTIPPSGTIAGVYARTDASRGVWKAPAGTDATLAGVQATERPLTDRENGILNPRGVNCNRIFPVHGALAWGARTLQGDDQMASEWKYVPVRRLALFIEESLYRGTQWVVFEPNDEPLWALIRLNVGAFMQNLFRQGAFQGRSPREAYLVKCDRETTTQNDINLGIVNFLVGFAPLKPAEFVIIRIQQLAGQVQT